MVKIIAFPTAVVQSACVCHTLLLDASSSSSDSKLSVRRETDLPASVDAGAAAGPPCRPSPACLEDCTGCLVGVPQGQFGLFVLLYLIYSFSFSLSACLSPSLSLSLSVFRCEIYFVLLERLLPKHWEASGDKRQS